LIHQIDGRHEFFHALALVSEQDQFPKDFLAPKAPRATSEKSTKFQADDDEVCSGGTA
jgi:hypothetical protein